MLGMRTGEIQRMLIPATDSKVVSETMSNGKSKFSIAILCRVQICLADPGSCGNSPIMTLRKDIAEKDIGNTTRVLHPS
jgi:hypothetical protein